MAEKQKANVSEYKKKLVHELANKLEKALIIGLLNMQGMPAAQLQQMRGKLRKDAEMFMTKKRIIKIAIENIKDKKKNIAELEKYFAGMPALLFTKENPFKLYKILSKSKSAAPAKPGDIAPNDIIIPAGPTPFAPGPIISELSGVGLKAMVQEGKVAIREDAVVARKGEVIKQKVADVLAKFNIQPMEIGLDLVAIYEDGIIYGKDVLAIDEDMFMGNLMKCISGAFEVSLEAGYATKDNAERIIAKAFREAKGVAIEGNILADAVVEELVERSQRAALILKDKVKIEAKIEAAAKAEVKEEIKEIKQEIKEIEKEVKKAEIPAPEKKEIIEELKKEEKKIEEVKEEVKHEKAEEAKEEIEKIKEEIKQEKAEEVKEEAEEIKEEVREVKKEVKAIKKDESRFEKDSKAAEERLAELHEAAKQKIELGRPKKAAGDIYDSSKLFDELKKKGTLRGVVSQAELEKKFSGQRTPEEIIKEERKKMEERKKEQELRGRVPSAYELMQKKKKEAKK